MPINDLENWNTPYSGEIYVTNPKRKLEEAPVHTVPLPKYIKAEPCFDKDENGKLIAGSFDVKGQSLGTTRYMYALAVFSFEGHVVLVYGNVSWVIDVIHQTYEYDVFEVGFDEILLFHLASDVSFYVQENHYSNFIDEGRTVHSGF